MIAIEPVIAPATIFSTISVMFETIDRPAALVLLGAGRGDHAHRDPRSRSSQSRNARRGAAPVADRVLLLGRQLGHRAAVARVVGHEGGVVAEAAVAARLARPACPRSVPRTSSSRPARVHVGERADVGHATVAVGRHLAQQLGEVLLVASRRSPGVARRAHTRCAAERRGLDARVVGDRRRAGGRAAARALTERVVGEGRRRSPAAAPPRPAAARPRAARAARPAPGPCAGCGWRAPVASRLAQPGAGAAAGSPPAAAT